MGIAAYRKTDIGSQRVRNLKYKNTTITGARAVIVNGGAETQLYSPGNEHSDVTGGYDDYYTKSDYGMFGRYTVSAGTKAADSMVCAVDGLNFLQSMVSGVAIDITNYDIFAVDFEVVKEYGNAFVSGNVKLNASNYDFIHNDVAGAISKDQSVSRTTEYVNISNKVGYYYVTFYAVSGDTGKVQIKIHNMWLATHSGWRLNL